MNNIEIRRARLRLGLNQQTFAKWLEMNPQDVSRMEMDPSKTSHRKPPVRAVKLIKCFLAGYEPEID